MRRPCARREPGLTQRPAMRSLHLMARIARVVIPNVPHHVVRHGNGRTVVFPDDEMRQFFLDLLAENAPRHGLIVHAYCLMPTRVHLVVVPPRVDSLASAFKSVYLRYTDEFNRRAGVRGLIWEGRADSCPLDETFFPVAVRFVEQSPKRERLVRKAECYRWSSAAGHCGRVVDPILPDDPVKLKRVRDWSAWLRKSDPAEVVDQLRSCTRTGRPAGSKQFIDKLERLTGRTLHRRPPGRPRKTPLSTSARGRLESGCLPFLARPAYLPGLAEAEVAVHSPLALGRVAPPVERAEHAPLADRMAGRNRVEAGPHRAVWVIMATARERSAGSSGRCP